jgi:hypothetical protein
MSSHKVASNFAIQAQEANSSESMKKLIELFGDMYETSVKNYVDFIANEEIKVENTDMAVNYFNDDISENKGFLIREKWRKLMESLH